MLQRIFLHLSLVFLFALTQLGVATHAISHLSESIQQQHQQDQNSHESQCGQCISYSHAADTHSAQAFSFDVTPVKHIVAAKKPVNTSSVSSSFYSARAPPSNSQA
jgi:hypothetical protein